MNLKGYKTFGMPKVTFLLVFIFDKLCPMVKAYTQTLLSC